MRKGQCRKGCLCVPQPSPQSLQPCQAHYHKLKEGEEEDCVFVMDAAFSVKFLRHLNNNIYSTCNSSFITSSENPSKC